MKNCARRDNQRMDIAILVGGAREGQSFAAKI
jgi:hypothetical protein